MYKKVEKINIEELLGKIIVSIDRAEDDRYLGFNCSDGYSYVMYSEEWGYDNDMDLYLEDVCGNLEDLLKYPITMAEEINNEEGYQDGYHCTWTFYKLATIKGYVTLRWCGFSNGYYSEAVDIAKARKCVE